MKGLVLPVQFETGVLPVSGKRERVPTGQYADLQYIRNTYAEKVAIRGNVWQEQSS